MDNLLQIKHNLERLRKIYQQMEVDDADYLWPAHDQDASSLIAISVQEINHIEEEWQIKLPEEYKQFLLTVGNTNVGPGNIFYRLKENINKNSNLPFPLQEPFLGQLAVEFQQMSREERWDLLGSQIEKWKIIPKDDGVLHICSYGCAIEAFLIINGPYTGKVWIQNGDTASYGPFGGWEGMHNSEAEPPLTNSPKDYAFLQWYEHWLDNRLKEFEET